MRDTGEEIGRFERGIDGLVLKASRWVFDRARLRVVVHRDFKIRDAHCPHDGAGSLNMTPARSRCLRYAALGRIKRRHASKVLRYLQQSVGYGMSVTSSTWLHGVTARSSTFLPFDLTYTHVHD